MQAAGGDYRSIRSPALAPPGGTPLASLALSAEQVVPYR